MHTKLIKSGQSVVIVSPTDNSVYKFPFGGREHSTLFFLLIQKLELDHSALPQEIVTKGHIPYFRFNRHHNLLNRIEVRKYIVVFVDQIVDAIQELHANNIAHMDIRLENICYCESTDHAVLIDLDRRDFASNTAITYYGNSTMYSRLPGWSCEMYDWRQLGIMIYFIMTNTSDDYHRIHIPEDSNDFLKKLFAGNKCPPDIKSTLDKLYLFCYLAVLLCAHAFFVLYLTICWTFNRRVYLCMCMASQQNIANELMAYALSYCRNLRSRSP